MPPGSTENERMFKVNRLASLEVLLLMKSTACFYFQEIQIPVSFGFSKMIKSNHIIWFYLKFFTRFPGNGS